MEYSSSIYAERLAAFQEDMAVLSGADFKNLPDLTGAINHRGGEPARKSLESGFYLAPEAFQALAKEDTARIQMTPNDALKVTREDSRHQVFLGRLDFIGQDGCVAYQESVAVKSKEANQKELAMYQLLGALGINTFHPFGFAVMENGNRHLLTKVRKQVTSIDAIEWKALCPEEIWVTCQAGVETEVLLNRHGLFAGDLEFKNVATEESGRPVVVDPEFMTSYREVMDELLHRVGDIKALQDPQVSIGLGAVTRTMGIDFTALTNSYRRYAMPALPHKLRPKNTDQLFDALKRTFYNPYRDMLTPDMQYYPVLRHAFDALLLKRKEQARTGTL